MLDRLNCLIRRIGSSSAAQAGNTARDERSYGEVWRDVPSKVVFLDFDGVLHRGTTGTFHHLPRFEDWLGSAENVGVVISSSWRNATREYLENLFRAEARRWIIGKTAQEGVFPTRRHEIEAWVTENNVHDFIVLDDDSDEFEPGWQHWLPISRSSGLTANDFHSLNIWALRS